MSNPNVVPATQAITAGGRTIIVVGADLISSKAIAVIQHAIDFIANGEDLGLNSIVLRDDNLPVQLDANGKADLMLATVDFACGAMAISMEETITRALESSLEFDNLSIYPLYWHNLLMNIFHEGSHLLQLRDAADKKGWVSKLMEDEKFYAETEKAASIMALELFNGFVQTFECEPPAWGEEPYFAAQALGLYSGDPADDEGESESKSLAITRLDDRIFVYAELDDNTPAPVQDFRGYIALNSKNPDDPAWNQELIPTVAGTTTTPPNTYAATVAETTMPAENAAVEAPVAEAIVEPIESGPEGVIDDGQYGAAGLMMGAASGFGPDGMQELMDTPIPTIPAANGGVMAPSPTPMADNVAASFGVQVPTAAPGAPGTPFVMGGQAVGTNVVPDAPTASQQQFVQPGAQTQPVAEVYPNHNMSAEEIQQIWYGVAGRIFDMMFSGPCKFQPGGLPHEAVQGFGYADAVATIPVMLNERERMVVVKCECTNAMGQREAKLTSDGELRGWATPKAKLPMYKVWLNCNGVEVCRTLMPQNPNTGWDKGQLSKTAAMARQGHKILYIREGNDAIKNASPQTSLKAKCVDGQWEVVNA